MFENNYTIKTVGLLHPWYAYKPTVMKTIERAPRTIILPSASTLLWPALRVRDIRFPRRALLYPRLLRIAWINLSEENQVIAGPARGLRDLCFDLFVCFVVGWLYRQTTGRRTR